MLNTVIETEQQNMRNTRLADIGVFIQNSAVKGDVLVELSTPTTSRSTSPIIMVKMVFTLTTMLDMEACSGIRTANAKKYPAIRGE